MLRRSPPVPFRFPALALALPLLVVLGCVGEAPPAADADRALLLRLELGADGLRSAGVVGVMPASSVPTTFVANEGGDVAVEVSTGAGDVLVRGRIASALTRIQETDGLEHAHGTLFEDGSLRYLAVPATTAETLHVRVAYLGHDGARRDATMSVPTEGYGAPPPADAATPGVARSALSSSCGDGEIDDSVDVGFISLGIPEHCDDGNTEDGDGCSARCRHELVHLGGPEDPEGTVVIVFAPRGHASLEAFLEYARESAEFVMGADFYAEHPDAFSFWALPVEEGVNDTLPESDLERDDDIGACPGETPMCEGNDDWDEIYLEHLLAAEANGKITSPDHVVFLEPSCCRAFAYFGGHISMGGRDRGGLTLPHELGHAFGFLADEYSHPETDAGECFSRSGGNVSTTDDEGVPAWSCMAENLSDLRCPDGRPVYAHSIGGECGRELEEVVPCRSCMMAGDEAFCPVCRRHMTARLLDASVDGLLTTVLSVFGDEDDPLLGVTDGACECTPSSCGADSCGSDGCFGSCGGCGSGERCGESRTCESRCPTGDGCVDDRGVLVCDGGFGILTCESGLRACLCAAATSEWAACTACM